MKMERKMLLVVGFDLGYSLTYRSFTDFSFSVILIIKIVKEKAAHC